MIDSALTHQDVRVFWAFRHGLQAGAYDAAAVIDRITTKAVRESGCHYEVYEAKVIRAVRAELATLEGADRLALSRALLLREIRTDDQALADAEQAEALCLDEVNAEAAAEAAYWLSQPEMPFEPMPGFLTDEPEDE